MEAKGLFSYPHIHRPYYNYYYLLLYSWLRGTYEVQL